jgi:hypothetical protein
VQFHKEIAARAENSFFSIYAKDSNSVRWSSLYEFNPDSLSGPWELDSTQLISNAFKIGVEQGDHESVFLGGPCFLAWEKSLQGGFTPQWRPILYREVGVLLDSGVEEIIPEQGRWSLSPLVISAIDRLQLSVGDDPDKLVTQLLEKSSDMREGEDISFASAVKQSLIDLVPELEEVLNQAPRAGTFNTMPSDWVLFAPTTNFSALTRYLMADYVRLEHLLEEDSKNIGGLTVLDDGALREETIVPDLLPLVPLNDSQQKAVERILGNHPLTVISGPPGCGKSQVVVSLLLNAWANGTSVLFASNNNSAVDVIRERLDKFESEFPIAVRAGNRQKNNIIELLRRTINLAADSSGSERAVKRHAESRKMLIDQRTALQEQLNSKLPQRADEGLRTALNAYAQWAKHLEEVESAALSLQERFQELGIGDVSLQDLENRVTATESWLNQISSHKALVREDEKRVTAIQRRIAQAARDRNNAIASVELDSERIEDWHWLQDGPSVDLLIAWEKRWTDLLSSPIEDDLVKPEWSDEYERWTGEAEAAETAKDGEKFAETVRIKLAELAPQISEVNRIHDELASATDTLVSGGLEKRPDLQKSLLASWSTAYSTLISLPASRLDCLPWSQASKLHRSLKRSESQLRQLVPLSKWTEIGALNEEGRAKLANSIELLRVWKESYDTWLDIEDLRKNIETSFEQMRASAGALGMDQVPINTNVDAWQSVTSKAYSLARLAQDASDAWRKRTRRDTALTKIDSVLRDWRQIASGLPIRESWEHGMGADFTEKMNSLQSSTTAENLQAARSAYYSGTLRVFIRAWQDADSAQQKITVDESELAQIPELKDRIADWYQKRPKNAPVISEIPQNWPTLEIINKEFSAFQRLASDNREFEDVTRPQLISEAIGENDWAVEKLRNAIDVLPQSDQRNSLNEIFQKIQTNKNEAWPVDQISECFRDFSPDIIRAEIDRINAELERGSFEESKAAWLKRLDEDERALNAVDQLEKTLRRKNGNVDEDDFDLFRDALRLVPIWITTAQAAQAIPLEPELFDLVVIDEASQCTLTNLLPLLYRGKRLAIIGDSDQLPSIPTIQEAEEQTLAKKYKITEFISIIGHATNDVYSTAADALPRGRAGVLQLNEHFRSDPQIIGFSNRHIYQQRLVLKTNPSKGRRLPIGSGVHRVNVSGQANRGDRGRSWMNKPEAEKVLEIIRHIRSDTSMNHLSIGVVTPFAAQKEYVREMLASDGMSGNILADSAYGFQGDERDVIIFSAVVGPGITPTASRWVESPPNLVNVALTRARLALYVVADFDYCMQQDSAGILRKLAEYCRDIQVLRQTSPAELELFSWMTVEGWTPNIHPFIGDIEVDFELRDKEGARLVIEVDGDEYHNESRQKDESRDAFLRAQGCRIYRTPARAVLETPFAVIQEIKQLLNK